MAHLSIVNQRDGQTCLGIYEYVVVNAVEMYAPFKFGFVKYLSILQLILLQALSTHNLSADI